MTSHHGSIRPRSRATWALALLLLTACGAGGPGTGGHAPPPSSVARVEISPRALLLTEAGAEGRLQARAFDASGQEVDAEVRWLVSGADGAFEVAADGLVRALSDMGGGTVVAQVGATTSAAAVVLVAKPVAGARLVADDEVRSDPEPLGDAADGLVAAVLAGPRPDVGTLVVASESAPLAGRVVAVSAAADGWRVEVERVSLAELFERLAFDLDMTFDVIEPVFAPEASVTLVQRTPEGLEVHLAFDATATDSVSTADVEAASGKKKKTWLEKYCKVDGSPILKQAKPLQVELVIGEPWILQHSARRRPDGELEYHTIFVEGRVKAKAIGGLEIGGQLAGKVACEVYLTYVPLPIFGALSALIHPTVPIALYLEIDGSAAVTALEFGLDGEVSATVGLGYEWNLPVGAADGYTNLSHISDFGYDVAPRFRSPDDPAFRLKGGVSAGIKTGLTLGNGFWGYDLATVLLVGRFSGDLAPVRDQILQAGYASNYGVKLLLAAKPTDDFEDILRLLFSEETAKRINETVDLALTFEVPLATSPRVAEPLVAAITTPSGPEPVVDFDLRVVLDPATTKWPVLPYAVRAVEVHHLRPDGDIELLAKVAANTFQTVFDLSWTAYQEGSFHAFVVPAVLPFVALELGKVQLGTPYRVRAIPAADEVLGLPVPTTYFGSFDLVNEGAQVQYQLGVPGTPEVIVTSPPSGTIPAGGTVTVEYSIVCTEETAGVTAIDLTFTTDDGAFVLGEAIPTEFSLSFNCENPEYAVTMLPQMASAEGVAPTVLWGGFTLTNRGAPVDFEITTLEPKVVLLLPTGGRLEEGAVAEVMYGYDCPQPEQVIVPFWLTYSDAGTIVTGDLPTSHGFDINCTSTPPPCEEDEECEPPPFPGDGDDDGDGTGDGDVVDVGGATGRSWGDPHLVTLDGRPYDFHGVGDYVLSRATDPSDDFEVQVRYRALRPGEPWYTPSGISVGVGVAASVRGHAVTVLIDAAGRYEAYLDGAPLDVADNLALELPNRGTLRIEGSQATITWPDSTSVTLDGRTGRARGFDYLDDIRLYVPSRRLGKVEGLLGDADRDPLNDLRVPGGEPVLQISPAWLYGEFRDAWRVPVGDPASLFAVGPELFDPDFPAVVVTLSDFTDAERTAARAACEAAGVVSPLFLQSCMLDVLITGDPAVAEAAFLADPGTPKLSLTPALAFVYGGSERYFGAVVEGSSDRRVTWSASRGTLTPWNATGTYVRFTPPEDLDEDVVLTASLVADGRVTATARVVLLEAPCVPPEGFDKVWQGGVDASWSNPDNWLPAGVPTNVDRAYVCAASANQPALTANAQVGALATEPGARVRLGSATLAVHGDLHLATSSVEVEAGSLRVVGDGAVLTGTLPTITVNALTAAGGPLTVDGNLTLGLDRPAHVDPNGHTLTVLGNLATTSVGCLTSTRPEDRVVIHGATTLNGWSNQAHCALTTGTLELRGDLSTTAGQLFDRLTPGPGHTTRLTGSAHQTVTIGGLALGHGSGNRFHDLEIANPAGVTFAEPVHIRGDVRFAEDAGSVTGSTTAHLKGNIDEPQGGARWQVATTNLRGPERTVTIPATIVNDLVINSLIVLGHPLAVEGHLTIATTGAARLDPGPHTLTVNGDLATVSGQNVNGCLAMTAPGAHVIVHGRTILNGWTSTQGCEMTDGVFELRGDLTTTAGQQFHRLTPGPGLTTRLTGTTHQTITIGGLSLGHGAGNRFHDLEIANPAGVTFTEPVDIRGDVRYTANAGPITSAATVYLEGSVHEPLGGARWQVPTTDLRGTDRELVLPTTLHGDLIVNGEKALQHPLTVTGDVTIATATLARFDPAAFTLTILGNLTTGNASNVNGCLPMTNGTARVVVHGNARFNGYMNDQLCGMNAGVLELHGDLSTAGVWFHMFTPAGSHLVRFVGAGVQEVAFGGVEDHPSTNRFHNVEIVNAAGVTFTRDTRVHGQLEVVGRLKNEAILFVPLGGHVWLRSGATFDNTFGALSLSGTCFGEKGVEIIGAVPEACWPEEEAPPGGG